VTGWLQIQGLKKSDEGVYICHTKNKYGATYASARLKVIDGIYFFYLDVKNIKMYTSRLQRVGLSEHK